MKTKRNKLLVVIDILAVLLFAATFSPFVIPAGEIDPFIFGVSYTMFTGLLVSVLFVILAFLVSLVNKEIEHAD
ncbi:hypothetical protein JQC67_06175 [Aurantibacter crassamenti]|uniref:hypothetical protein n=1 Tax=Aurantibacter crassamenti TaxID=1837375 RepID=UPI00193A4D9C|nr:hypothetical protein [Aurantibacter crassamenti]MBM1105715.1 hypothetical protein [Aurantibacter crassamenti]